jgi:hypothetical protein
MSVALQTPVAFVIFNRPDTTERVFAEIAKVRPVKLLVIADGPRASRPGEADKCAQTRALIERVDWPCEVLLNYAEQNLGCRKRVSSGLDWVFQQVEEAIILEDDCLPDPTFFAYCEQLLERYRDDRRVSMICGDNFQFGRPRGDGSYYFSKYAHIWGWASWRRAWQSYDVNASLWPTFESSGNFDAMTLPVERDSWRAAFNGVHSGTVDTWDYQWTLSCWCNSMFAVMPQVNLISNIGFGPGATHTTGTSIYSTLPLESMTFPLRAPSITAPSAAADGFTAKTMFGATPWQRFRRHVKKTVVRGIGSR